MAEGDAGLRAEVLQQTHHGVHALAWVDLVEVLLDLRIVVQCLHFDAQRVAQELRRQLLDACRVGGGEQQGLPACRELADDVGDAVVEAHVEHAVGLVEHQGVQAVEFQGALAQVLLDASRGAHDDMRAIFQRADLRAERHAAAQGQHLDVVGGAGQPADFLGHLVGQLAGRAQHQRLAAEVARIQRAEQADAEGGGLAAAGLGLGDQVLALEDRRQTGGLDRRHFAIAEGVEIGQQVGGKGKAGEGGGGHEGEPRKIYGAQCSRPGAGAPGCRGLARVLGRLRRPLVRNVGSIFLSGFAFLIFLS
ncbi:hypothetical protein D3C78_654290 [compost metagenome]